jgi:hypothetical protein
MPTDHLRPPDIITDLTVTKWKAAAAAGRTGGRCDI